MTTLLLSENEEATFVISQPTRRQDRLLAHLRAGRLDHALAAGASPDSSVVLSLRASALIGARARRELAAALRQRLHAADQPPHPFDSRVRVARARIIACRELIEELVQELLGPDPVDARGVARLRLLLIEGASPLYHRSTRRDLARELRETLDALAVED